MADPYPRWRYFPGYVAPPGWVAALADVFAAERDRIDSLVEYDEAMNSNAVLAEVTSGLKDMGFQVEEGKKRDAKLPRPVLFGEEGAYLRKYEIDAFHSDLGIALEVEAGRALGGGNAIYRDIIQSSLMVDVQHLALAVPLEYRSRSGKRTTREAAYSKSLQVLDAIYSSRRLELPFDGLLLIGY